METSSPLDTLARSLLKDQVRKVLGEEGVRMMDETQAPVNIEEILPAFQKADTAALQQSDDPALRDLIRATPVAGQLDKLARLMPSTPVEGSLQSAIHDLFAENSPNMSAEMRARFASSYTGYLERALEEELGGHMPGIIDQVNSQQFSANQQLVQQVKDTVAPFVLEKDEQKKSKAKPKPGPAVPEEQASTLLAANGIRLSVARMPDGWRIEGMDGLVISTDPSGSAPAGEFYQAFLGDMPRSMRTLLDETLLEQIASGGGLTKNKRRKKVMSRSVLPVKLSPKVQERVFPFSPGKSGLILLTNDEWVDEPPTFEDSAAAAVEAIAEANRNQLRHVVLPVIGGGALTDEERATVVELILKKLKALHFEEPRTLQNVTIVTTSLVVCARARQVFNLLNNNRAQAFRNDQPGGEDLLGIAEEVNALADTLLLREVRPPLAVGIMGGWGSGKSFVMHLIQKRMAEIRSRGMSKTSDHGAQDETIPSPFVGHVYQINFNAWTYAKSNLWASLMQTIFFELNRQMWFERNSINDMLAENPAFRELFETVEGSPLWRIMGERKNKEMEQLRQVEQQLAQTKIDNEQAMRERQKEVDQVLGEQVPTGALSLLKQKVVEVAQDSISQSARQILNTQTEVTESQIEQVISSLRSTSAAVRNLYKELLKHPVVAVSLIGFVLLSLWGVPFLADLLNWQSYQDWMRWMISFVPLLLPALNIIGSWSRRVDDIVREFQSLSETERANWQSRRERLLAQRQAEDEKTVAEVLQKAQPEADRTKILQGLAEQGNVAASQRLLTAKEVEVEDKRRRIGPVAQYVSLLEFVHSRLDEASYESQLGLLHQVKRDIDELNAGLILRTWDGEEEKKIKQDLFPRGEPRIVLFIDDLDRCPPPRVVEVLEAVQLLLNTELFVVVIGLDTRYVTRALEKEYKEILQHEGDPSGLDYIEKIIQIPYRVRPIGESALRNYLKAQMDILPPPALAPRATTPSEPVARGRKRRALQEAAPAEAVLKEPAPMQAPPSSASSQAASVVIDLPPEVVKFQQEDLDDLVLCCRQVDLTPRSIKRLVNVFKLIEIYWFRASGENRSREVKEAVMGLLALSAAYPEIMREVFVRIDMWFRDEALQKKAVFEALSEIQLDNSEMTLVRLQWKFFKRDVEALKSQDFGQVSFTELEHSTFNLVRSFSFVGDPSYWEDRTTAEHGSEERKPE